MDWSRYSSSLLCLSTSSTLICSAAIFTVATVKGIASGLRSIAQLSKEPDIPGYGRTIPLPEEKLRPEDSINLESLVVLATCDEFMISRIAASIFCERFLRDGPALQSLLADMASRDAAVREQAEKAYDFLKDPENFPTRHIEDYADRQRPLPGTALSRMDDGNHRTLRRRRREAVIVNDGDHPPNEGDVYMRHVLNSG